MAITFVEQRKKQKYLFSILAGLLLLIFFVFCREFFAKPKPIDLLTEEVPEQEKIKINFEIFQSPWLQELEPFEESVSVQQGEEVGRENPFLPY